MRNRTATASALTNTTTPRRVLLRIAQSRDADVSDRIEALKRLESLGATRFGASVGRLALSHATPTPVRVVALLTHAELLEGRQNSVAREVLEAEDNVAIAGAALEALALDGDPSTRAILLRFLSSPSAELRCWALFSLASQGHPVDKPVVSRYLDDEAQGPFFTVGSEARAALSAIDARTLRPAPDGKANR